jgi:CheY-like chemotaxis protein
LVSAGYVVRIAVDGLDALRKLREGLPDMIISDLNMPHMSGTEFLDIVRKRFPQIPVIVMSAAAPEEMPEGLATDAYFHKNGFELSELLLIMLDLSARPPLRTTHLQVDVKPVEARWDGDGHYIIDCDDCLRPFSVPRVPHIGRDEKWTVCVHCRKVVQFLVADGDSQSPARP